MRQNPYANEWGIFKRSGNDWVLQEGSTRLSESGAVINFMVVKDFTRAEWEKHVKDGRYKCAKLKDW